MWPIPDNGLAGQLMCMYSVVGDYLQRSFPKRYPDFEPYVNPHPSRLTEVAPVAWTVWRLG
jgi:hypothetical protein